MDTPNHRIELASAGCPMTCAAVMTKHMQQILDVRETVGIHIAAWLTKRIDQQQHVVQIHREIT